MSSRSASESRCSASASLLGTVGQQLEPVAEAQARAHGRGRGCGNRPRSAPMTSSPACASASRNGRGSRRPKKLPAWVIAETRPGRTAGRRSRRNRSRCRSRAGSARGERRRLGGNCLRDAHDRVGVAGDEPCERRLPPHLPSAMGVLRQRVPQIGDPADAGCPLGRETGEVHGARRRGGEHDVGRSRRTSRIAAGAAVRFQSTLASGTSRPRSPSSACRARRSRPRARASSSAGPARARAHVARAMHGQRRMDGGRRVPVQPLRVVGREHVDVQAEVGEMLRRASEDAGRRARPREASRARRSGAAWERRHHRHCAGR